MKLLAIVLSVAIVAGTAATMTRLQFVEEHETITQLVWNEHEALLISGMRRDGWRGSYAGYALQLFRGAFGDVPEYESNREWVLITHGQYQFNFRHAAIARDLSKAFSIAPSSVTTT